VPVSPSLTLTAAGTTSTTVTNGEQFTASGDTSVAISVAQLSGGRAALVDGPDGTLPRAVQFPPYVAAGTYPRAVVRLSPSSGAALDPGSADFEYGAVFRLDTVSDGRSIDNGDNVFQRGLSSEPSMFKLQVDHGHPSCKVAGSGGAVVVTSPVAITPNSWYQAVCSRVGSTVTVSVRPYLSQQQPVTTVGRRLTGTLTFGASRPATIGGKVTASGAVVAGATDQFNGAVAQVWTRRL
jgi:hypothetical protein